MRIFILIFCILFCVSTSNASLLNAQENIYSDELLQLRNLNAELTSQLTSASQAINQLQADNDKLKISVEAQKELEITRKALENKSYEVRILRQKLMLYNDEKFFNDTIEKVSNL